MPGSDLADAEYAALGEFRHRLRAFLAFSEANARAAGLTPQQHQLLLAVRGSTGAAPTIGELADRLIVRHHTVVELVDRLARGGFVERVRTPADRRRAQVLLTRKGRQVLRTLSIEHRDELRRAGPELAKVLLAIGAKPRPRRVAGRGPR